MKFFDSHCHLDFEPLSRDAEAIIERAYRAGVEKMVNIGSSIRGSRESVKIAGLFPNIYASIGIHPHEAELTSDVELEIEKLRELVLDEKVVAIGEIGLDFFVPPGEDRKVDRAKQVALFEAQLDFAAEVGKPVIIHTRSAEAETLKILKSRYKILGSVPGVIHCFTGGPEFAQKLIELGYSIGFTGFVTFDQEKFDMIRESVKTVPIERILIETDAPFLAPEPYRGKTNEPAYVVEVAKKIAELKNLSVSEVAEKTYANAEKLFLKK